MPARVAKQFNELGKVRVRFIFQNSDGFSHTVTGGSYSWVIPTTTDFGLTYLNDFYRAGLKVPQEKTIGTAYKGFNDSLAAWGAKRVMSQQCGQTWLQTFNKANAFYNSSRQLNLLQVVTWNDYEEGTEIESGIDNCLSVSASVSGDSLSFRWKSCLWRRQEAAMNTEYDWAKLDSTALLERTGRE